MALKIATYKDVKSIDCIDNGDRFVALDNYNILSGHKYVVSPDDMKDFFNGKIIVREMVAKKITMANEVLGKINPNLVLFVSYGYRTLEIQRRRFNEEYDKCDSNISQEERIEFTHTKIAVPGVAGHPTGGAVDITIYDCVEDYFLDMGCEISDFSSSKYVTYAPGLLEEHKRNRQILHDVMVEQGFCHYFGEWWHFCYGDKEWAFFYDKKVALYEQKALTEIVLKK